jgi:predicted DNA-binding transcriptional regulator AlpA
MQPLTFDQLNALPTAVDLTTAARALGIGRTKAYQLAKAGEFPCRIIVSRR